MTRLGPFTISCASTEKAKNPTHNINDKIKAFGKFTIPPAAVGNCLLPGSTLYFFVNEDHGKDSHKLRQ